MEIRLSPELEAKAQRAVASGRYPSAENYFVAAIELLAERDKPRESLKVGTQEDEHVFGF